MDEEWKSYKGKGKGKGKGASSRQDPSGTGTGTSTGQPLPSYEVITSKEGNASNEGPQVGSSSMDAPGSAPAVTSNESCGTVQVGIVFVLKKKSI